VHGQPLINPTPSSISDGRPFCGSTSLAVPAHLQGRKSLRARLKLKGKPNGLDCFDLSAVWLTAATSGTLAVGEMRGLRRASGQVGGFAGNPGNVSAGLDQVVARLGGRGGRDVLAELVIN